MSERDKVKELFARWVEHRVLEESALSPEELCAETPELLEPLRERIRIYEDIEKALASPERDLAGQTLAHYEIEEKLGEGGMGEVYAARDTQLGRRVALKFLPSWAEVSQERLQRFEREAKLLASLNHPNIATLHGFEAEGEVQFLVMELVPGETLADRIARGPVPVDEALPLFLQIAEGLEAAHEQGVIHRDLKPANIKVSDEDDTASGRAKILDFGLAKAMAAEESDGVDASQSPTLTAAATQRGEILGTAAYMSPEQVRGRTVDKRTDIWAFGCCLYEALSGHRPFEGKTASDTLAKVLEREPAWEALPEETPRKIRDLLVRCLQRSPRERLHDIADARIEIGEALAAPRDLAAVAEEVSRGRRPDGVLAGCIAVSTSSPSRSVLPWIVAIAFVALTSAFAAWLLKPGEPLLVSRLAVTLPTPLPAGAGAWIAVSPDGRHILYTAEAGIFVRSMEEAEAALIPGTKGGFAPFFSPDGESIGFFTATQLRTVRVTGSGLTVLTDFDQGLEGAWDSEDRIFFGQSGSTGIFEIDANGGQIQTFAERGDYGDLDYPSVIPGSEWVLFTALVSQHNEWDNAQIVAQSVKSGDRKVVIEGGHYGRYVPTGHLVYVRHGHLFAVAFDARRAEAIGEPVLILDSVSAEGLGAGNARFAVAREAGTLVFAPGAGKDRRVAIVGTDGSSEMLPLAGPYWNPRVSPDRTQLAIQTDENGRSEIWVYGLSGASEIRRLPQDGNNRAPIWTPDSQEVTFASDRGGQWGVYSQPADGSGPAELLVMADEGSQYLPNSWSPDGRILGFTDASIGRSDIGFLDRDSGDVQRLFEETSNDSTSFAEFSPNGQWVAYSRSEGSLYATTAVYLQPYPPTRLEQRVTEPMAVNPAWSDGGDTLMFYGNNGQLRRIAVATDDGVTIGREQTLVLEQDLSRSFYRNYDPMPDGRIVMVTDQSAEEHINVILNWFEELKERVPVD